MNLMKKFGFKPKRNFKSLKVYIDEIIKKKTNLIFFLILNNLIFSNKK